MRLCMLVHGPYPVGEPRVAREARVALERGLEVDVICLRADGDAARELVDGVHVIRLPLTHRRGRGFAAVLAEYVGFCILATGWLAARPFRYKVVHVHNPPDFLILAALVPRLFGARVLFDIHDLSPDLFSMRFEGRTGSGMAGRLLHATERFSAKLADEVITVHEPYRRVLASRGIESSKIHVVMNSLDEDLIPAVTPHSGSVFRVVYHGTVTHWYGVETLVHAAERLRTSIPNLRVEIYGNGDAIPALRDTVRERSLEDYVWVSGRYMPHRETLRAVAGASVGVIPNLPNRLNRFALSSKLFEYVMLGIPVVCSRLQTLEEHFSDDELVFFEPGDVGDLARAIAVIFHQPEEALQRADRARMRCEEYRWAHSAARYAALL